MLTTGITGVPAAPGRTGSIPLLILSWSYHNVLPVLRSLGSRKGGTWVAWGGHDALTARSRHARDWAVFDAQAAPGEMVGWLRDYCRRHGIALLMPNDEPAVRFVAANREALKEFVTTTLVPNLEAFDLATDKGRLASFLQQHGIPCPRTLHGNSEAVRARNLEGLRFPVLARRTNLSGGYGIHRCDSREDLIGACARFEAERSQFIVQELVAGPDVDCSLVAEDGKILAWTTQRGTGKSGFTQPAGELMMEPHPRLLEQVAAVIRELRWSGVAHIDTIYDARDDSYLMLEVNGRFWGSLLASTAAGVNFPKLLLDHASGMEVNKQEFHAMRFYWADIGWRRLIARGRERYRARETQVPFFLRDPWPELKAGLSRRFGL